MKLTKLLCLTLTLVLLTAVFAGCKTDKTDDATEAETTTAAETEAQTETETEAAASETDETAEIAEADRIPANFAGDYQFERCSIEVTAQSDTEMKFLVHWGSSAMESRQWEMSGTFDPDTLRVNYSDCVCKDLVADENGNITETVVYENGIGRIQFYDFDSLGWMDEQDNAASGMEFTKLTPAE